MTQHSNSDLSRGDSRKAGRLKTMPDDLFEEVKNAVDAMDHRWVSPRSIERTISRDRKTVSTVIASGAKQSICPRVQK